MGAWGERVLENDKALDYIWSLETNYEKIDELFKCEIEELDKEDFESVIEQKLLLIELIDISLNGIDHDILGNMQEYGAFLDKVSESDFSEYLDWALSTLELIEENDFDWKEDCKATRSNVLNSIKRRLLKHA